MYKMYVTQIVFIIICALVAARPIVIVKVCALVTIRPVITLVVLITIVSVTGPILVPLPNLIITSVVSICFIARLRWCVIYMSRIV